MKRKTQRKTAGPRVVEKPGLHIGTSGWSYGEWDRVFYPEGVKSTYDRLAFYAGHFHTVEVNYSFYHLPKPETYQKWAATVPDEFLFAVKASRFITHIQKLVGVKASWTRFITGARTLGDRLGPILLQFPPSLRADPIRLSRFLDLLRKDTDTPPVHPVFEFRHPTWFTKEIYTILRKADAALCIAQSSRYPCVEGVTADLVYYRFHGPQELFASRYSDEDLRYWAGKMKALLKEGKTVYAYFNNTLNGYAVENARTLRALIEKGRVS
jgi:uncharacterized protein YecE (DUF72 family)